MLTLAICTNNNYNYLLKCIDSIQDQNIKDFNLIIQDNTIVNSDCKKQVIEIVTEVDNFYYNDFEANGLSQSRNVCSNLAAQVFDSEYIHYIDDDVLLPVDFVQNLLLSIKSYSDLKAVGSKVLPYWGDITRPPWFSDSLYPLMSMLDFGDYTKAYGGENGVWWLAGANICFHIDSLHEVGGFSQQLGRNSNNNGLMGSEENEVLEKLKNQGLVLYDPNFPLFHHVREERLNKEWMLKRCVWQSVCDVLTDSNWQNSIDNSSTRIRDAAQSIIMRTDQVDFSTFLSKMQYLVFKLLQGKLD
jgi:glycosyltransferase involved in cell wall biosynthesis